jgi:hypothetical protein
VKACKRWFVPAGSVCSLCRSTAVEGVLCDLATPVELTTIMKFVCLECASSVAEVLRPMAPPIRGQR